MFLVVKINILASDMNRTRCIQSAVPHCHWLCCMSVHFIPDFEARSQNCKKWPLASLCPSVRPHGTTRVPLDGFAGNFICVVFSKNLSREIECHENRTRIIGTSNEHQCTFLNISRSVHLRMGNISHKSCRENQNTHFVFINYFSRKSYLL